METEWHTAIAEDEVGHNGAKQLFSGLLVWSIFHNGIEVKVSFGGRDDADAVALVIGFAVSCMCFVSL
jgi:hypothetical protein